MSTIIRKTPKGFSANALRTWGFLFMTLGVAGRGIIQNSILHLGAVSNMELLAAIEANPDLMIYATLALICQAMETCAMPVFSFLLVEGFNHTSNFKNYLLRVLATALVSEIPYNLAIGGVWFDLSSRNPVFGLVLSLVMLYLFDKYQGKDLKMAGIKILIFAAAFLWSRMLGIVEGNCMVIMVAILWALRNKPSMRGLFGFSAAAICSLFNVFYIISSMSFILVHLYNQEQGSRNKYFNYLFYPVLLLCVGLAAKFLV